MARSDDVKRIRRKYLMLGGVLNERTRRLWAATEAQAIGWGGVLQVSEATGLSRPRIVRGLRELEKRDATKPAALDRIRRPGGGGKYLTDKDATLLPDLDALVDPTTRGDIGSPRVVGSTSASRSGSSVASLSVRYLPPPPGRRIRSSAAGFVASRFSSSRSPRTILGRLSPVASETWSTPPQPIAWASVAAHSLRVRSFNTPPSIRYFRRMRLTSSDLAILHQRADIGVRRQKLASRLETSTVARVLN